MKTFLHPFLIILFLVFIFNETYAQVGIGTTNPNASSILDIESTTQGVLTPRMTSLQRLAIVSPAEGLLVFDLDEDAFYYYDATATNWVKLEGVVMRDNYKLVKSVADLADELTVGGNIEYELSTNTYYEINGTINLGVPINLNGAYIAGEDTNEDKLVSTGIIFSGTTGGSIRNLTLTTTGAVFSLNGSGSENLIFRDSFVINSGSVGTISNFNLVFVSTTQFLFNTVGITYTNINQLLLNTLGWDESNGGIYETYVGTFDVITKQGGFSEVIGATAAIDVTGITSTTGSYSIRTVDFYGGGNYINGSSPYTGYNFTRDWDVDSPGIPVETDGVASGNFYYDGSLTTGFTQTINSTNTDYEVESALPSFTANSLFRFTSAGGDNRLVYDGVKEREFNINTSMSVRVSGANGNFYAFYLVKNGTALIESNSIIEINSSSQIQSISLNANVSLANGDYIEVHVQRLTGSGTDTLAVFSENLSIN
ncbi:hypothetical protein PW52_06685 [Tamlana sedimentorum]|uniref:Cell wall anchor protein n=1 Tax=Neotamlana sedimentorum TaxID=1435349 RepID=A0A0D7WC68_9FLAO|nr:hypothetical protein [Tamlana sedimentorum]KJD36273.1 hypothetical protein PW52_06685 [Tamlana sedimentorum]